VDNITSNLDPFINLVPSAVIQICHRWRPFCLLQWKRRSGRNTFNI